MDTIWVLFEKKDAFDSEIMQYVMSAGSGGDNVHCEIILPHRQYTRASAWLAQGVAFKDFAPLAVTADKHEIFVIKNVDAEAIYNFHFTQVGRKYDQIGLFFTMFLGWRKKKTNPDRWFCSELNYYELLNIAKLPLPEIVQHHVTPQMLYIMLTEMGYKPQKLSEII